MKKVLIVSPHFPPINAADIHRVRQSLPYFEKFGYQPVVLSVSPDYVEMAQDVHLVKTVPNHIEIHEVRAYSTNYSKSLRVGNLGIRAFFQLYQKGNELLRSGKFDLIYFSTTVFSCMPLGRLWKRRFKVPFVIDMQDPWRNDYYLSVPKSQRPPKFWFAHRLNSFLEHHTIPAANGIISVSQGYIDTLKNRYPKIKDIPFKVLTFGASTKDFDILSDISLNSTIKLKEQGINIVYAGRGGQDLGESVTLILKAFKMGIENNEDFLKCHFWFVGTSYAPEGQGKKTIETIAKNLGIESYITEITDRQPYFEVLSLLTKSDIIFIPSSSDTNYTPSKLYPYILAKKPLLSVLHSKSSIVDVLTKLNAGEVILFDDENALENCYYSLSKMLAAIPFEPSTNWEEFKYFTAEEMTRVQCDFFDMVISNS